MDGGYAFFIFRALKFGGVEMGFFLAPRTLGKEGNSIEDSGRKREG